MSKIAEQKALEFQEDYEHRNKLKIQEEPVSEDLDEAVLKYLWEHPFCDGYTGNSFKAGAEWAYQHPKNGLWDAEKVINFLKERATLENSSNINIYINGATYHFVNDFIEDLRKAMED